MGDGATANEIAAVVAVNISALSDAKNEVASSRHLYLDLGGSAGCYSAGPECL